MPFLPDAQQSVGRFIADPEPDTASANKQFARAAAMSLGDQAKLGVSTAFEDAVAPWEAAANAGTGLVFGFPAYIGAALSGLAQKHLLGMDVDPKELADTISGLATYHPQTQRGQEISSQLNWPLQKIGEGAEYAGHKVSDVTGSAAAGAVTDATLQMLPMILLGELGRKMGGQRIGNDDLKNVSQIISEEKPEAAPVVEKNLRTTYQQTGVGPYSVLEAAKTDPTITADLSDPHAEIPRALQPYTERPALTSEPAPGEGAPLLDVSGPTVEEKATAEAPKQPDQTRTLAADKPWSEQPEPVRNALADHVNEMTKNDIVDIRKRQSVLASLLECLE